MICPTCWGDGFLLTCCDDLCHGLGYCIHGDGEEVCPDCHGWGEIADDEDYDDGGYDDYLDYQERTNDARGITVVR